LRCGPVRGGYDLGQQLGKVTPYIEAKDAERITGQASLLYLFARTTYCEFLKANPAIVEELAKKYETADRDLGAYMDFLSDQATSTLALAAPLKTNELADGTQRTRLSPEIGIFLDQMP